MIETVKIEKLKCDILGEFQTQWNILYFKNLSVLSDFQFFVTYEKIPTRS